MRGEAVCLFVLSRGGALHRQQESDIYATHVYKIGGIPTWQSSSAFSVSIVRIVG